MSDPHVVSHQTVRLGQGRHRSPDEGVCVMELASMLAGERFTDRPQSVCRVIAALLRACNDRFDDSTRQRLYRYAADAVGTAGDPEASEARVLRCAQAASANLSARRSRWWRRRRSIPPPSPPLGAGLGRFITRVVDSFPATEAGTEGLIALVEELLTIRSPRRRPLRSARPAGLAPRVAVDEPA